MFIKVNADMPVNTGIFIALRVALTVLITGMTVPSPECLLSAFAFH